jgi:hypothetical protein
MVRISCRIGSDLILKISKKICITSELTVACKFILTRNLREMIVKFQDLAPKINEHLFYSLLNDQKSIQDKSIS